MKKKCGERRVEDAREERKRKAAENDGSPGRKLSEAGALTHPESPALEVPERATTSHTLHARLSISGISGFLGPIEIPIIHRCLRFLK